MGSNIRSMFLFIVAAVAACGKFVADSADGIAYRRFVGKIAKGHGDHREYQALELHNRLRVVLVSDATIKRASAAMVVSAGSQDDPPHMLGLAHLAEHLVMSRAGREKEDFLGHVVAGDGWTNAATHYDRTTYWFNVAHYALNETLGHFSRLFTPITFLEEEVAREATVVDAEYRMDTQKPEKKLIQIMKLAADQSHPYSRFTVGSTGTLLDSPKHLGKSIAAEVASFLEAHYMASKMQLVVMGSEPLATLVKYTVSRFSDLPTGEAHPTDSGSPFPADPSVVEFYVPEPAHTMGLEMGVECPTKPLLKAILEYVASLVNSPAPGGLLHTLKERHLFLDIKVELDMYREFSSFMVVLSGVPEEMTSRGNVVNAFSAYLRAIARAETLKERMLVWAQAYHPAEPTSPGVNEDASPEKVVENIGNNLHLGFTFNDAVSPCRALLLATEAEIRAALETVARDSVDVFFVTKGEGEVKEPFFGGSYTFRPALVVSEEGEYAFNLPFFSPRRENHKSSIPAGVQRIRSTSNARVWRVGSPHRLAISNVQLRQCHPQATSVQFLSFVVEKKLLSEDLKKDGVQYEATSDGACLVTWFQGPDEQIPAALAAYTSSLARLVDNASSFDSLKAQDIKRLRSLDFDKPVAQAIQYTKAILNRNSWSRGEIDQLQHLTWQDFSVFCQEFLRRSPLEMFVVGDLDEADINTITDAILVGLGTQQTNLLPPNPSASVVFRGNFVQQIRTENPTEPHNAICYTLHTFLLPQPRNMAISLLLRSLLHAPFYKQLRTFEHLGYEAWVHDLKTNYGGGLSFIVQSGRHPAYLESRIDAFLNAFYGLLSEMPEEKFQSKVSAFKKKLQSPARNTKQTAVHYWRDIAAGTFSFDLDETILRELQGLTKSETVAFYNAYLLPNSTIRAKMSTYVLNEASALAGPSPFAITDFGEVVVDVKAWKEGRLVV